MVVVGQMVGSMSIVKPSRRVCACEGYEVRQWGVLSNYCFFCLPQFICPPLSPRQRVCTRIIHTCPSSSLFSVHVRDLEHLGPSLREWAYNSSCSLSRPGTAALDSSHDPPNDHVRDSLIPSTASSLNSPRRPKVLVLTPSPFAPQGILNLIDPGLSSHLSSVRSLTSGPLHFQRKRQGVFTSGTFESVTISFAICPSQWGPRVTGVNVLPRSTGKGRVINVSDVGEVRVEGNQIVIRGKGGDLLFHGVSDTGTAPGTCDEIKVVVDYEVKGLKEGAGREEARGREESLAEVRVRIRGEWGEGRSDEALRIFTGQGQRHEQLLMCSSLRSTLSLRSAQKSALEKKVYFAKREVEMMAKRKKVRV